MQHGYAVGRRNGDQGKWRPSREQTTDPSVGAAELLAAPHEQPCHRHQYIRELHQHDIAVCSQSSLGTARLIEANILRRLVGRFSAINDTGILLLIFGVAISDVSRMPVGL